MGKVLWVCRGVRRSSPAMGRPFTHFGEGEAAPLPLADASLGVHVNITYDPLQKRVTSAEAEAIPAQRAPKHEAPRAGGVGEVLSSITEARLRLDSLEKHGKTLLSSISAALKPPPLLRN